MDAEEVVDKASFAKFLAAMQQELNAGAATWDNADLVGFLEAMAAWAHDAEHPVHINPWTHAAKLLWAGAFYE